VVRYAQGIRFTLRQLRKSPLFTAVALLTMALGIGANTAIFSVMNAVLLRTLPVPHPEQLVYFHLHNQPLSTSQTGYSDMSLSMPVFQALRNRHEIFQDLIGFAPLSFDRVAVRVGAEPEEVLGEEVSGNFFSGLRVQPSMGRGFNPEDESTHAPIAVLNYDWWNTRFAADKSVLGKIFDVKGVPFTIVGVAPAGFNGIDPERPVMNFWVPLQNRPELNAWGTAPTDHTLYGSPNWLALMMLARLQPTASPKQAEAAVTPVFLNTLASASPVDPRDKTPQLTLSGIRGVESLREDYQQPLRFLMLMVALVLVIACANIVMLLLARNSNRLAEFSLRRALGANRTALFLQLLEEAVVLVAGGAALGWLFSGAATQALTAWSGLHVAITADRRVLLFTVATCSIVALVFGLAPLSLVSRLPLHLALRSTGGTSGGARHPLWGRKLVVTLQIALCVVLVSAAGLLYRTLRNLESSDLGMRTSGVLVFGVTPQSTSGTDADVIRFHQALLARLRSLPGVDSATVLETRFGDGSSSNDGVLVDGRNPSPAKPIAPMRVDPVGPNFLRTFGIPLRLGRDFQDADTANAPKVAIINQTFADRYLPGVNPLGHHIQFFQGKTPYTIAGVCANFRYTQVREGPYPMAFFPFAQTGGVLAMQYALHTAGNAQGLLPEAARILRETDPNLPLEKPILQREQFDESVSQQRLVANLSVFFGALAAFLVVIGLYGTVSYGVSRRNMEIGLRMALGAQRPQVLRMILLESLTVVAVGLAVGIPAALAVARMLRAMLFGLNAADPVTLMTASLGMAAVTLAAAFFPAYRAARIDPMQALRGE
jgi:predicted permease